ncbi:hypothetical protein Ahia01_001397600 [Argonauta hians]
MMSSFLCRLHWLGQKMWTVTFTTVVLLLFIVTTLLHMVIVLVSQVWGVAVPDKWKKYLSGLGGGGGGHGTRWQDSGGGGGGGGRFGSTTGNRRPHHHQPVGLAENITLPETGSEALQRLLDCRDKDPYSILGLHCHSTDEEIKRYYKRQAILVHPDKNHQRGAEEAFKILNHAFDILGEPEKRQIYDAQVVQSDQAVKEFNDFLVKLTEKIEKESHMMLCSKCGGRHQRLPVSRPWYSARYCQDCNVCHPASQGDVWAESSVLGFLWRYYTCLDDRVYDITEWVSCQKLFKKIKSNAHHIYYRIEYTTTTTTTTNTTTTNTTTPNNNNNKTKHSSPGAEADLKSFLEELFEKSRQYNQGGGGGGAGRSTTTSKDTTTTTTTTGSGGGGGGGGGRSSKKRRKKKNRERERGGE